MLCSPSENTKAFKNILNSFGIDDKEPWQIRRIDLFGKQPRFEFAADKIIILQQCREIEEELDSISFNFNIFKNLTHHFVSTEYDVENDTLSYKYISEFLFQVIRKKIQSEDSKVIKTLFDKVPLELKGHIFEPLVRRKFAEGFFGKLKFYGSENKNSFEKFYFPPVETKESFYTEVCNQVQMIYQDMNLTRLFGTNYITQITHYMPISYLTYVFDDILVFPDINRICHILFVQTTTDKKHNIVYSGFFGMLWSLIALSFTLNRQVIPWFVFFVKPENFEKFNEPTVERLRTYFKHIRILIICEDSDFNSANKEPKFHNFLFKNTILKEKIKINKDKHILKKKLLKIETPQVKDDLFVLPLFPSTEDISGEKVTELLIEDCVEVNLFLTRPSFVSSKFAWRNNISCSVEPKRVVIENLNKVVVKNSEKKNLDEDKNLNKILTKVNSNGNENINVTLLGNSKVNLSAGVGKILLENSDYCVRNGCQGDFNFAAEYSNLLPKSICNKTEFCITQPFSNIFQQHVIPRLVYGLFLNVVALSQIQSSKNNFYLLKLYFINEDHLKKAQEVLKKFTIFFENPVGIMTIGNTIIKIKKNK
jgi:hypothetical protein